MNYRFNLDDLKVWESCTECPSCESQDLEYVIKVRKASDVYLSNLYKGVVYECQTCKSRVSGDSETGAPKGVLADSATRSARKKLHKFADHFKLYKQRQADKQGQEMTEEEAKKAVYTWLNRYAGLKELTSIAQLSLEQANKCLEACRSIASSRTPIGDYCKGLPRWVRR